MTVRRTLAVGALTTVVLAVLAGCGSTAAPSGTGAKASGIAPPPLATSVASIDGTSWAVVEMGGSAAQHNNFWELFARPAKADKWTLVTPLGVASNGGIAVAPTGAQSAVAAFLPSQDLMFSPLATTVNGGAAWSQGAAPVTPGLGQMPDTLAAGPDGQLLALTRTGEVQAGTGLGATWKSLTTEKALAKTSAGRACALTSLTATAWTATGTELLGGTCTRPTRAGIFALRGGWQAIGPALSAAAGPVSVVALESVGPRLAAVLAVGSGSGAAVLVAWSTNDGGSWTLSPALAAGTRKLESVSVGAASSVGVVLADGRGETIGFQSASWQSLPTLPAGTATLASGPDGQFDAIAVHAGTLTAWQLSAATARWGLLQRTEVQIPYGSSS